jgi:hypothetical protein
MPDPKSYDDKEKFISDCISQNIKEGLTRDQASGKCYGMWDEAKKSEAVNNIKEVKKCLKL